MKAEQTGFTLLEVLMALVIVSVALVAVVQSSQNSATTLQQVRDQSAALHVANQVLMDMYQRPNPVNGLVQGQRQFQDRSFYWKVEYQSTDNARINRLEVSVSLNRDFDYLQARLTGFKSS